MAPKPHRVLLDRVSGYADEAAAYMRRRRAARRPFARLHYAGGRAHDHAEGSPAGALLNPENRKSQSRLGGGMLSPERWIDA